MLGRYAYKETEQGKFGGDATVLIMVMVTQIYICVKIHKTVYQKEQKHIFLYDNNKKNNPRHFHPHSWEYTSVPNLWRII